MPHSVFYNDLQARLEELKNHMLPEEFSPTGEYDDQQLDLAKGYILLAHAEFESYLEEVSRDLVMSTVKKWKGNNIPSHTLLSFLCCYHSSWSHSDETANEEILKIAKNRVNVKDSTDEIIDVALKQYIQKIKDNHGIKEKNFKSLVIPTGLSLDDLDGALIVAMDSFGSARGEVAHLSKKRVKTLINPQDEFNKVNAILNGLCDFDLKIQKLLNPVDFSGYAFINCAANTNSSYQFKF